MERASANHAHREFRTLYTVGALGGLTDARLLELFLTRGGDAAEDAFAALVQRHGPLVLSVCRRMLPGSQDVEDAFQATFLILVRRAAAIGRHEQLANWLYGVAVRTAKEARRRAARQHARERRLMNVSKVEPLQVEDQADWLPILDEELNRLPPRYRAALVACELEGKSRREAALQLGLPEGTLSTHLARGRKLLRERLSRRGVSLGTGPLALPTRQLAEAAVSERLAGSTVRAALGYAGGVTSAGPVTALVEIVLKFMLLTRLAVLITSLLAVGLTAAVTGAAVLAKPDEPGAAQAQVASNANPPAQKAQADLAKAAPQGARVRGIVVDEAGTPLAGFDVRANLLGDRQSHGVTNASGQFDFRIRRPELAGTDLLVAGADRTRQAIFQYSDRLTADEAAQPVRIVCKPARVVTVRVLDRDGKPVPDAATAFLSAGNPVADGRTDADGRWTVRVPVVEKDWTFFARKAGMGFDYAMTKGVRPWPDELPLTLDGARTVRVKAVDRDGKPIAGVNVGLSSIRRTAKDWFDNALSANADLWPVTDEEGVAVLDWLPEVFWNEIQLGTYAEGLSTFDRPSIERNRPVDPVTITFLPLETLSGRITHADGRPAAGIVVAVSGQGPAANGRGGNHWNEWFVSDADGRYQFRALAEQVYVIAVHGKEWAAPYRAGVVVHAGKPVDGVDFVLGRPTRVHGRLTIGADGKPSPFSSIRVIISQEVVSDRFQIKGRSSIPRAAMNISVQTDGQDEYEVFLGPGEYQIGGPKQSNPVTLTIPAVNPPAEIRHDVHDTAPTEDRSVRRPIG